jgi:hypothetical protein
VQPKEEKQNQSLKTSSFLEGSGNFLIMPNKYAILQQCV